jgi:hypothetical protein
MLALGCGSGESRRPNSDGGSTGGSSGGKSGEAGSSGASGTTGSGGSGGDSGSVIVDTIPPTFAGVSQVEAVTGREDAARVSWSAASDDQSAPDRIAYRVYRSATSKGEDYTRAHRCGDLIPDAGPIEQADVPCYTTTPAGALAAVVRDAVPAHTFYYVVRAVDAAGNEDSNTREVSFSTPDATAPEFGGVNSVQVVSAHSLSVGWGAAYDLGTPDSQLKFAVFAKANDKPDPTVDAPLLTTKAGQHSALLTGLDPLTTYYVLVRAVDGSGNQDKNTRTFSAETPEGIPPGFDGAKRASADGTDVRIFWPPATDNATDQDNILYDVYVALATHAQNFAQPPQYTSKPGASSILIQGLQPGTKYFFVVRARDSSGNSDANTREVTVRTGGLADHTPPTFNGASGVTSVTPTTVQVSWSGASDDVTLSPDQFLYRVYLSTSSPVDTTTPTAVVRGATTVTIAGLKPNTKYYAIVRAVDQANNADSNSFEQNGTTLAVPATDGGADVTAPSLGGDPTVNMVVNPATRLDVSWAAATGDPAGSIRYHVCASVTESDCLGQSFNTHIVASTDFGVTSTTLQFLDPRTTYFVLVRAEDKSGNLETGKHEAQAKTATSWKTNVVVILFDRCVACHDYDKASNIVNVGGNFEDDAACTPPIDPVKGCPLKIVDPGRPVFSLLYRRVNPLGLATSPFSATVKNQYSGPQEPRDTTDKLTAEEDDTLRDWIEQGAYSN